MGDQNGGDARPAEQLRHGFAGGRTQAGVKRRERLVEQHQAWPLRQRPRQRHALLLAAGELVRAADQHNAIERHHVHQLGDALVALRCVACQAKPDVVGHAEMGEQRTVLRHVTNAALVRRHGVWPIGQQLSIQHNLPRIGRLETGNDAQHGGFSGAGRTHDGGTAAGAYAQIDAIQRRHGAIRLAHGADVQQTQSVSLQRTAEFALGSRHSTLIARLCVWTGRTAARLMATTAEP